jgi:hydroxyethylthiazole kinase
MEREQLARRLGEPLVRAKLRRAICRFPSEWDRNTVIERYGWLRTEEFRPVADDPTGTQRWERFSAHARAISFTNLPADFLKADWRFHPREFVEVMRTCGWLQLSELTQLMPRVYGVTNTRLTSIGWVTARARFRPFAIDLNKTFRKYLITTAARQTHFLAQTYIETAMWATMEEFGRAHQQRRANGTPYWPAPAMEYYQAFYGRGIMQLTWAGNYASYGSYRPIPDIAVPHVFNDSRITQTSLHYWQDPRNRQGVVVERPCQWAPRFDPVVISTNTYNACDSGCHYWVSKNVGQHQININRACDLGITTGAVGRVSVLVNGGVFGYSERQGFAAFVDRYRGDTAEASSSTTMKFTSRNTVDTCYVDFTPQRP